MSIAPEIPAPPARRPQRAGGLVIGALALAVAIGAAVLFGSAVLDEAAPRAVAPTPGATALARPGADPLLALGGTADEIATLEARVAARPEDATTRAKLGIAYLQRAREQGDPSLYDRADALLTRALADAPDDLDAILGAGVLALARHDFDGALALGRRGLALTEGASPVALGVIGDAQTELGRYDAALATFTRMVDQRPGLASYARLSYAYELRGERAEAIRLMREAARAGAGAPENTAWVNVQLAQLLFDAGDLDDAERELRRALFHLPGYARAQAGLAAVRAARGDLAGAEALYAEAAGRVPLPEIQAALGDVRAARGDLAGAQDAYAVVRAEQALFAASGGDADLELALFDARHPDGGAPLDEVVARARRAVAERPSIFAFDALAWSLHAAGDCAAALPVARRATALGTRSPQLLYHHGAIAACAGRPAEARRLLTRALAANPLFHPLDAPAARALLDGLAR